MILSPGVIRTLGHVLMHNKKGIYIMAETKEPRRGDIWFIRDHNRQSGVWGVKTHIQAGDRPCIIVSNDYANKYSPTLEVVFTTTKKKKRLPTHFRIRSTPYPSTVLCEAVVPVPRENLCEFLGHVTPEEEEQLNACLCISLGLSTAKK